MDFTSFLFSLGSIGPFASRIFLPAFVSALLLRFGNHIPILQHSGLIAHLHYGPPTWFTHNVTLTVLGILSLAEVMSQKSAEARMLLHEFDLYLKPGMAALTSLGFIGTADAGFVQQITEPHQAGYGMILLPAIAALGTLQVGTIRRKIMRSIVSQFEGTRVATWISWLEDAWVVFGILFLFLFAVVMLFAVMLSIIVMMIVRKRMEIAEEHRRIACAKCGVMIYPCAIACGSCGHAVVQPLKIGFFGQSKPLPTTNIANHPCRLAEKRRCPRCAARLPVGKPFEPCPACGTRQLSEQQFVQLYSAYVGRRMPVVLLICLAMSAVPILGMIAGSVYYEIVLIAPFSQYLSMSRRFMLRWEIRLLFIVMAILQILPGLGALAVPLMASLSYALHRKSYRAFMASPEHHAERPAFQPVVATV